jgi:hypothetical protein
VTYAIDAAKSHIDINAAKTAVRKAFAAIDALNQPAGIFFQETSTEIDNTTNTGAGPQLQADTRGQV